MTDAMQVDNHYDLAQELTGHEADVRAVCCLHNGDIVSGSRDHTIKVWTPSPEGYKLKHTILAHQHQVSSLLAIPPGIHPAVPTGGFASGGMDNIINVFSTDDANPTLTLIGHENNVCTLGLSATGDIISGSWDKTVRIWTGAECTAVLKSHSAAVWAVLGLPDGRIVSGGADNKLVLWNNGQQEKQIHAHQEPIRCLALVPGLGFLSSSNDTTIKLWSFAGENLMTLNGHSFYVYSVAVLPSGDFVSASEDKTVKVWSGGALKESVALPGGAWSVTGLPNGDFVSATADGVLRIWTTNPDRLAPQTVRDQYKQKMELQSATTSMSDIDFEKLPGAEALKIPGKKDGDYKIIRNGTVGEAYQWSEEQQAWIKLGEVVTGAGSGKQEELHGKKYDYIFDIDIGDGGPTRKLGYNKSENPYEVAQEFIWREQLQQEFLDEIAKFIVTNTTPVTIGQDHDPQAQYSDPFTGPKRPQAPQNAFPSNEFFPQRTWLLFDTAQLAAAQKKILEFNAQIAANEATKVLQINADEEEEKLLASVIKTLSETSRYHASFFSETECKFVHKLLQWPDNTRFPALDILRMMALHPNVGGVDPASQAKSIKAVLVDSLISGQYLKSTVDANVMLAIRGLCNLFKHAPARSLIAQRAAGVLSSLASVATNTNKNVRVALATALINFGVLYVESKPETVQDQKAQIIAIANEILGNEADEEAVFRTLVALGTVVRDDGSLAFAKGLGVAGAVSKHTSSASAKVKSAAGSLLSILK